MDRNTANLWKDDFNAIANSVGSTDNRDPVCMGALRTVPGHNKVIDVHELRQIVKIIRLLLAMMEFHTEKNKWYKLSHLSKSCYSLQINQHFQVN